MTAPYKGRSAPQINFQLREKKRNRVPELVADGKKEAAPGSVETYSLARGKLRGLRKESRSEK